MILRSNIKLVDKFPNPTQSRFDRSQWLKDHGQSNVIINCAAREIYYADHWTPLSLKCAFGGKEFYRSGNAIQCSSDESFLIYNEGKEYTSFIHSDHDVESFTINFSEQFVSNMFSLMQLPPEKNLDVVPGGLPKKSIYFFERSHSYTSILRSQIAMIRSLATEFQPNQEAINECLAALFETLLAFQSEIHSEVSQLGAVKKSTREELYKRLYMARDLMDSSYQSNITLDTLAEVALINPFYLLRLFKSFYKITPHQYLRRRRIEEARKLLMKGQYTVSQVCNLVGFSDISSFSKLFKQETGVSPSFYSQGMGEDVSNPQGSIIIS